jgi:hypothetical protein
MNPFEVPTPFEKYLFVRAASRLVRIYAPKEYAA